MMSYVIKAGNKIVKVNKMKENKFWKISMIESLHFLVTGSLEFIKFWGG